MLSPEILIQKRICLLRAITQFPLSVNTATYQNISIDVSVDANQKPWTESNPLSIDFRSRNSYGMAWDEEASYDNMPCHIVDMEKLHNIELFSSRGF